ncbi:MAG: ABC transporter ATP-binding protein [Planctomycetota bacterium]
MVEIQDLSKIYLRGDTKVEAVKNITLDIPQGQRLAVLGRSGSGKSTLLNLLAGLDRPTSGSLTVDGKRLDAMTKNELADYRCHGVGIIFQSFQLMPHLTAFKNVELALTLGGVSTSQRRQQVSEALERVGLADRQQHLPGTMSGGEQQRVAIARALANKPALLLADEPTGNLDSTTATQIETLIADVCSQLQTTLILVTHDEPLAERFAERTIRMKDGVIFSDQLQSESLA